MEEPAAVVTQEQIFENIHLHKEVLGSVKQQPLSMRRKLKIVHQVIGSITSHLTYYTWEFLMMFDQNSKYKYHTDANPREIHSSAYTYRPADKNLLGNVCKKSFVNDYVGFYYRKLNIPFLILRKRREESWTHTLIVKITETGRVVTTKLQPRSSHL